MSNTIARLLALPNVSELCVTFKAHTCSYQSVLNYAKDSRFSKVEAYDMVRGNNAVSVTLELINDSILRRYTHTAGDLETAIGWVLADVPDELKNKSAELNEEHAKFEADLRAIADAAKCETMVWLHFNMTDADIENYEMAKECAADDEDYESIANFIAAVKEHRRYAEIYSYARTPVGNISSASTNMNDLLDGVLDAVKSY